jgi:16S rRNA (cytosine1402-N4)-methyltransferase
LSPTFHHRTVLGPESIALLDVREGALYADVTLGGGGHSALILEAGGRVLGLDRDPAALAAARSRLAAFGDRLMTARASFSELGAVLAARGLGRLDGLVADLGVSSPQLDLGERGFSLMRPGPVDMRMGEVGPTAAELIAGSAEEELADIIRRYGEERHARRVARALVEGRPFADTVALAGAVAAAVPGRPGRVHKATRTFQALRIAVNDELGQLEALLEALPALLAPGGRAVFIAYHSLEDRLVKRRFRTLAALDAPKDPYGNPARRPVARLLTRRAVTADDDNPRARSARLRALQMLNDAEGEG